MRQVPVIPLVCYGGLYKWILNISLLRKILTQVKPGTSAIMTKETPFHPEIPFVAKALNLPIK